MIKLARATDFAAIDDKTGELRLRHDGLDRRRGLLILHRGLAHLLQVVEEVGHRYFSPLGATRQDFIDPAADQAMYQMMGVFAEFERSMIQERVRAGLARAKSEGKRLDRPPISTDLENSIRAALRAPGRKEGVRKIAARFGVDPGTVQRISRPSA
ncbi:MAG: recombinase family protein [Sphingomonadaceae bacterium]